MILKSRNNVILFTFLALSSVVGTNAFVKPSTNGVSKLSTEVSAKDPISPEPIFPFLDNIYGEESRLYRRTVFTHDDWKRFRSPDRFMRNLSTFTKSGIYTNILREVLATTAVATFVVLWNAVAGGYTDFDGTKHAALFTNTLLGPLTLSLAPFSLSSPSLGLLLVFRTNTSYQRWDEARKNWGMNINHTRDLVRMGNAFYDKTGVSDEKRKEDLRILSLNTWSFVRAMKRHLSPAEEDEEAFKAELYEKLPREQAEAIINAAHRPNRALYDLSLAIENLPMHFLRKQQIQEALTIFEDTLGSSERLLSSPVPLFYTRHTARFLSFWLLFLPFALYDPFGNYWNHIMEIPAVFMISVLLFGLEELATQLEEPFTVLPMQGFCDKIENWCNEIVSWEPGDNGMDIEAASGTNIGSSIPSTPTQPFAGQAPPVASAYTSSFSAGAAATAFVAGATSYMDSIAPPGATGQYKSAKPLKKDSTGGTAYVQSLGAGIPISFSGTSSVSAEAIATTTAAATSGPVSYMDSIAPPGATGQYKSAKPLKKDSTGGTSYVQSLGAGIPVSSSDTFPITTAVATTSAAAVAAVGPVSYMDSIAPPGATGQYKSAKPLKKDGLTTAYAAGLSSGNTLDFSNFPTASANTPPPAQPDPPSFSEPAATTTFAPSGPVSYMDSIAPPGSTGQYKSAKPLKKDGLTSGYMANLNQQSNISAPLPSTSPPSAPKGNYLDSLSR